MSKVVHDTDDRRLAKAIAHPLRVQILGLLEHRTLSPKQLAGELGVPIENVSYHVRTLRGLGLVKLVRTREVRGTIQHYYDVIPPPSDAAAAWSALPGVVRRTVVDESLTRVGELVADAAEQDGFARADAHLQERSILLDEPGFVEASAIVADALARIEALGDAARARIDAGETEPLPAVAVALLFEAPDAAPRLAERSSLEDAGPA